MAPPSSTWRSTATRAFPRTRPGGTCPWPRSRTCRRRRLRARSTSSVAGRNGARYRCSRNSGPRDRDAAWPRARAAAPASAGARCARARSRRGRGRRRAGPPCGVAGRRAPAPAAQLDEAWLAVVAELRRDVLAGLPHVAGGRSSGGRVACRTAEATGAVGVLCLAFPLRPPGRPDAPSRLPELDAVRAATLVVQGERDPFGMPPAARNRTVVRVAGDHGLKSDLAAVAAAVEGWLARLSVA